MSNKGSVPLGKDLREIVSRESDTLERSDASDEECRESCTIVIDAIGAFLGQWTKLEVGQNIGGDVYGNFPLDFLRATTSKIVREVGPGDTLFRTSWLNILRRTTTKSVKVLEFVLEFLPCAVLPTQVGNNETKTGLLATLAFVVEKDPKAIIPILDCLQRLVHIARIEKSVAFHFGITHVSKVPDEGIGRVIKSWLDLASDEGDLATLVQAMRSRARSEVEVLSIVEAVNEIRQEGRYLDLFDEYLSTMKEQRNLMNPDRAVDTLRSLDVLILLIYRNRPEYAIEKSLDHMIVNGGMSKQVLTSVARFARFFKADAVFEEAHYSVTRLQGLPDHLVWLLIFLFLGPRRSPKLGVEKALSLAKDFGVNLFLVSDQKGKHRIISTLLQLAEECMSTVKKSSSHHPHDMSRYQANSSSASDVDILTLLKIQSVLFALLDDAAGKHPHVFRNHMKTISRSLKAECIGDESVGNICSLMVSVNKHVWTGSMEDGSVDDSSDDPFLVARVLLFSQKGCDNRLPTISRETAVEMCVRGLILATKIVASGHQNSKRVSMLWQSVRSVLLPPTNRLPHPRCANYGLGALRSFHTWNQEIIGGSAGVLSPGIFATLTSLLMTSRLVQNGKTSKKITRQKSVAVCYSRRLDCFEGDGSKPRKFNRMVFSFDALQNNLDFCSPSNWELSCRFVFNLVDAYLCLGRMRAKGKWIAHAWVEATFEFPLMDFSSLRATNARQQRLLSLVEGTLNDFDTYRDSINPNFTSEKEFCDMLKQTKKRSERTEAVQCLLQNAMSYCLGLAISASVLHNTFAHYVGASGEQDNGGHCQQRTEGTSLMQYQLAKIYDLVGKCRIMHMVFRGISNANLQTKRRQKKSNRGGKGVGLQFEQMVSTTVGVY
jgi:hypothetical protein